MNRQIIVMLAVLLLAFPVWAQTTAFNYQGNLSDNGQQANGNYDFEFCLYDSVAGTTQIGNVITKNLVSVTDGVFSVSLDFGNEFPGAGRWLEIRVRQGVPSASENLLGAFTTLAPRQPVNSSPYSIKSVSAETANSADSASTATNADQLGGVSAGQYVLTTDPRLDDERAPTPGSADYIQNTTAEQPSTDFNISGTGKAAVLEAATQYNLNSERFIHTLGSSISNTFVGRRAGSSITDGNGNSFVGSGAGESTMNGGANSFFGTSAGQLNTSGSWNSFFGYFAGENNTSGGSNSFFGQGAGSSNSTGSDNSFFGKDAGSVNSTGTQNAFFGNAAAAQNTVGGLNSIIGVGAGFENTTGSSNSFFGSFAGNLSKTGSNNTIIGSNADVGATNLNYATAVGSDSVVSTSNTIQLGRANGSDAVNISGNLTVAGTFTGVLPGGSTRYIQNGVNQQFSSNFNISGTGKALNFDAVLEYQLNGTRVLSVPGVNNTYVGAGAGLGGEFPASGSDNAFFGYFSGRNNTASNNAFFGANSGGANTTGADNSFFGSGAGEYNSTIDANTGNNNTFIGRNSGNSNTIGIRNTAVGAYAFGHNLTGSNNTIVGRAAADQNTTGDYNTLIGTFAGNINTTGIRNTFLGGAAGNTNVDGGNNSTLGYNSDVASSGLNFATAIGAEAVVSESNTIQLGRTNGSDKVRVPGLGSGGVTSLCRNGLNEISTCSSSIRYKSNITTFSSGLDLIKRLRPVSFNWGDGGALDMGLVAEEVAEVEPLLTTTRDGGVEGVKYDRVSVVLVNAVNEQQQQIEDLKLKVKSEKERSEALAQRLKALEAILCEINPDAAVCPKRVTDN